MASVLVVRFLSPLLSLSPLLPALFCYQQLTGQPGAVPSLSSSLRSLSSRHDANGGLTHLVLQSRFGGKPLGIRLVCAPKIGTAALKGLTPPGNLSLPPAGSLARLRSRTARLSWRDPAQTMATRTSLTERPHLSRRDPAQTMVNTHSVSATSFVWL